MQQQALLLEKLGPRYFKMYFRAFFLALPLAIFAYALLLAYIRIHSEPMMAVFYVGIGFLQLSISLRAFRNSRKVLRNFRIAGRA